MTASAPGDVRLVKLIEDAAGLIVEAQKRPHTAPYHWAGALYQAGMLVPAGEADQLQGTRDRAERLERHVNELIDRAEKAEAKLASTEAELGEVRRQRNGAEKIAEDRGSALDELEAKLARLERDREPLGIRPDGTADPRVEAGANALQALGVPSQRAWDHADTVLRAAAFAAGGDAE